MSYPYSFDSDYLLQEQYSEEMFERRANGIDTVPFETWQKQREARRKFFEEWKNATPDAEDIAEGRIA